MSATFSITIPVYNVASYLRQCLDSVLAQTYTNWEAVCVDDGSTDGSAGILDEYASRDARIKVIHQSNRGVSSARQTALEASNGSFLVSCDPDDFVESQWLQHFADIIAQHDVDVVWTDFLILNGHERRYCTQNTSAENKRLLNALVMGDVLGSLWNKAIRISFIKDHHIAFPDFRIKDREDNYFLCATLAAGARVWCLHVADYIYRQREGSLVHSGRRNFDVELKLEQKFEKCLNDSGCLSSVMYLREKLKYTFYDDRRIESSVFYSLFPEVRNLARFRVPAINRFTFWLSVRRMRPLVILFLGIIRKVKR